MGGGGGRSFPCIWNYVYLAVNALPAAILAVLDSRVGGGLLCFVDWLHTAYTLGRTIVFAKKLRRN